MCLLCLRLCCAVCLQMVAYSTLGTQWGLVGARQQNPVLNHPVLKVSSTHSPAAQNVCLCTPDLVCAAQPSLAFLEQIRPESSFGRKCMLEPKHSRCCCGLAFSCAFALSVCQHMSVAAVSADGRPYFRCQPNVMCLCPLVLITDWGHHWDSVQTVQTNAQADRGARQGQCAWAVVVCSGLTE